MSAAREVWVAKGTTDDVTTCELCGRTDLKHTVLMVVVDVDGNPVGDPSHFGSHCAATMSGRPVGELEAEAAAADREAREAAELERRRAMREHDAVWFDFLAEHGTGSSVPEQLESLGGFAAARELFAAVTS